MNAKLTPKIVALLGVIVIGIVVAVGWFLLVSPQKSKASDLETQIGEVQTQVDLARLAATSDRGAEKTVDGEAPSPRPSRCRTTCRCPSVLRELLAQARASNVRLDSVKPQAASSAQNYLEIPMDVVVTGRYFAVEQYLKRLRREVTRRRRPRARGRPPLRRREPSASRKARTNFRRSRRPCT